MSEWHVQSVELFQLINDFYVLKYSIFISLHTIPYAYVSIGMLVEMKATAYSCIYIQMLHMCHMCTLFLHHRS